MLSVEKILHVTSGVKANPTYLNSKVYVHLSAEQVITLWIVYTNDSDLEGLELLHI